MESVYWTTSLSCFKSVVAAHCLWTKHPSGCPRATKAFTLSSLSTFPPIPSLPAWLALQIRPTSYSSPGAPYNAHRKCPLPGMLVSLRFAPRFPYSFRLSLNAISSKRPSLTICLCLHAPSDLHTHAFPSLRSFYSPVSLWPVFSDSDHNV